MPTILGVKDGSHDSDLGLLKRDFFYIRRKTFQKTWYVLADSLSDTEDDIMAASGVPQLGDVLNNAYAISKKVKETQRVRHPSTGSATALWEVTVGYDTNIDFEDQEPTDLTPTVRWHGETEEEVLEQDVITGEPIATDANEPILITTPVPMPVLEIKRYELYPFDPTTMLSFSYHTNSTTFWGAAAGSALMLPMEVDVETIEQIRFAVVTYRIKFKIKPNVTEPWKARVLHHGFKVRPGPEKEGVKQIPVTFKDKHGNPATVNLKLESEHPGEGGTQLPDDQPAEYKEFNRFPKANFNTLVLGPF